MNPEFVVKEERNGEDLCTGNEGMFEEEESPGSSTGHYVRRFVVKREEDDGTYGIAEQPYEERISSPEPSPEEQEMSRGRPSFSSDSQTSYKVRHRRMAIKVEELIRQVQHHPTLWRPSDPGYSDRYRKAAAWLSVCQSLYPDWDELDEGDKGILENLIQKRWRSARDQFRREMIHYEGLSGSGPLTKKPYMYLQQLMFLKPVLDLRPAFTKAGAETDGKAPREPQPVESDAEVTIARPAMVASESCPEPPPIISPTSTFQQATPLCLPGRKNKKATPTLTTMETFDGQVLDFFHGTTEEDPEDAFCRSLGHYIRQVPQGWRLRLRTAIQTLIEGFTPPNNPEQLLGLLSQVKLARPMHIESTTPPTPMSAYQSSTQPKYGPSTSHKTTLMCASCPQSSPHSSDHHHSRHSSGFSQKPNSQASYFHPHYVPNPLPPGACYTSSSSPSSLSPSHSLHPVSASGLSSYCGPCSHDSCSPDSHQSSPMNVSSSPCSPPRFLELN